jgi:hypothetical protein
MSEFALFAEGGCVPDDVLAFIAAAINLQMQRDVAPVWAGDVWTCVALDSLAGIRPNQTRKLLTFKKTLHVTGALGFHTETSGGVDYAEALPPAARGAGEAIDGTTTSHEVLETFGDPTCNAYVRGPSGRRLARELADPVEADAYPISVRIGPETRQVMVSNFVFPAWFHGGPGPYDFLKRLDVPEETTAGGYYEYLDESGNSQQVFADGRGRLAWLAKMTNPTTRVQARVRAAFKGVPGPVGQPQASRG